MKWFQSVGAVKTKLKNAGPMFGKSYYPDAKPYTISYLSQVMSLGHDFSRVIKDAIQKNESLKQAYRCAFNFTEKCADKIESQCSAIATDKNYNPKIHGPYCGWRWYGKPDTKFMEVKLSDLPAWFSRRNYSPHAIGAEVKRNYSRLHYLYIDPPYKNIYWVALNCMFWVVAIYTVIFEFILGHKRTTLQKNYYH